MEELLTPKEVSRLLKVSKPWPYVMVKRGLLPCYKMGKVIRFKKADIEVFLKMWPNGTHAANAKARIEEPRASRLSASL